MNDLQGNLCAAVALETIAVGAVFDLQSSHGADVGFLRDTIADRHIKPFQPGRKITNTQKPKHIQ